MRYSRILGTGSYLPEKILKNAELEKMVDTTDEWIIERTGIRQRHIAASHETALTMAEIAGRRALEAAGLSVQDIGMIVVGTTTPIKLFPARLAIYKNSLVLPAAQPLI